MFILFKYHNVDSSVNTSLIDPLSIAGLMHEAELTLLDFSLQNTGGVFDNFAKIAWFASEKDRCNNVSGSGNDW